MAADKNIEEGTDFSPKFDSNGLITAIAQGIDTGQILMVAFMNREALDLTIQTGQAVYYSKNNQHNQGGVVVLCLPCGKWQWTFIYYQDEHKYRQLYLR